MKTDSKFLNRILSIFRRPCSFQIWRLSCHITVEHIFSYISYRVTHTIPVIHSYSMATMFHPYRACCRACFVGHIKTKQTHTHTHGVREIANCASILKANCTFPMRGSYIPTLMMLLLNITIIITRLFISRTHQRCGVVYIYTRTYRASWQHKTWVFLQWTAPFPISQPHHHQHGNKRWRPSCSPGFLLPENILNWLHLHSITGAQLVNEHKMDGWTARERERETSASGRCVIPWITWNRIVLFT